MLLKRESGPIILKNFRAKQVTGSEIARKLVVRRLTLQQLNANANLVKQVVLIKLIDVLQIVWISVNEFLKLSLILRKLVTRSFSSRRLCPANIYLTKFNSRNVGKRRKICSNSTAKTPERIPNKEKKIKLNFHFTLGASKGFMKACKAFISPFEAPQRSGKIKI